MSTLMFNVEDAEEELLCRALYVDEDDIDVDESQPPATAEEYLKRVMKEAQQIKDVARAPNMDQILKRSKKGSVQASNRVEGNRSKATVLNISLPTPEWQKKQVADFSGLRQSLEREVLCNANRPRGVKFPGKNDEKGWCIFCFGEEFWKKVEAAQIELDSDSVSEEDQKPEKKKKKKREFKQEAPTTEILCYLKPTEVELLIELQTEWAELIGVKTPEQGLWIYSLMGLIAKPLYPSVVSSLRTLVMICSRERQSIFESGGASDHPMLIHLNLLICLVSKYFDQHDLAD